MWSLKAALATLFGGLNAAGQPSGLDEVAPDHVVVFVHGMGKALKGGTLQEWAQPLAQSLRDYALDDVDCNDCAPLIISQASAVGDTPALLAKVLRQHLPDHEPVYASILMTEASWGADFVPASATDTYTWAWSMVGKVFGRSMYLLRWNLYPGRFALKNPFWIVKKAKQIAFCGVTAVAGFLAVIVAMVILGVVIILANVPGLGRFVGAFVGLFAEFLGDPQVWRRRPLQAAAMRARIIRTLAPWQNSGIPITLVAHSQGAAVAGQVLFQNTRPDSVASVQNFVTVGSGVGLLGYAMWGGSGTDPVKDWIQNTDIRWVNLWGKYDFVPAGPISTDANGSSPVFRRLFDRSHPNDPGPGPEEHAVYNRSALIYDHIVYSRNRIEVIDPIARLILPAPVSDGGLPSSVPIPLGTSGDRRLRPHRVLVKSLTATRALAITVAFGVAESVLAAVTSFAPARFLMQCSSSTDSTSPWWSAWFCYNQGFSWTNPNSWLGHAIAVIVVATIYIALLNGPIWNGFHHRVERRRRRSRDELRKNGKVGDLPRQGPLTETGNPWRWVLCYVAAAWISTLPVLYYLASPAAAGLGAIVAVVLAWESTIGIRVTPLPTRHTLPGVDP